MIFNFFNHNSPEPGYNRLKPHSSKGITLAYLIDVLEVFQVSLNQFLFYGVIFFQPFLVQYQNGKRLTSQPEALTDGGLQQLWLARWHLHKQESGLKTLALLLPCIASQSFVLWWRCKKQANRMSRKILKCLDHRTDNFKVEAMSNCPCPRLI